MSLVLIFLSAGGRYAVPVEHCREVRPSTEITSLPTLRPDVVGLLAWKDLALSVVAPLGPGGAHVIVLDGGGDPFGLLVDEVVGVERLSSDAPGAAPRGQQDVLVGAAVSTGAGGLLLLVDVPAVGRWLRR
jgi:chemotaxis signal transduction protein